MKNMMGRDFRRRSAMMAGVCISLLAAGCASVPMPQDKLELARASIRRAEQAGAAKYSAAELQAARDKLGAAEQAKPNSEGAAQAGRLATEADMDARLAEVNARAVQAQNASSELDKSIDALRTESQRNANP